ncbi:MAG: hypothetical protein MHPSP_002666, partial [Paramarteilia canceri]
LKSKASIGFPTMNAKYDDLNTIIELRQAKKNIGNIMQLMSDLLYKITNINLPVGESKLFEQDLLQINRLLCSISDHFTSVKKVRKTIISINQSLKEDNISQVSYKNNLNSNLKSLQDNVELQKLLNEKQRRLEKILKQLEHVYSHGDMISKLWYEKKAFY